MSFRNDDEQRGYDSYREPGCSRYDGGYDYERGWDEHAREERREREHREEQRQLEEAEERHHQRRIEELAMERQQEEEAEFDRYQEEQRWREDNSVQDGNDASALTGASSESPVPSLSEPKEQKHVWEDGECNLCGLEQGLIASALPCRPVHIHTVSEPKELEEEKQ